MSSSIHALCVECMVEGITQGSTGSGGVWQTFLMWCLHQVLKMQGGFTMRITHYTDHEKAFLHTHINKTLCTFLSTDSHPQWEVFSLQQPVVYVSFKFISLHYPHSVNQSRAISQPPLCQPSGRMCVVCEPSTACLLCQRGVCCSVG